MSPALKRFLALTLGFFALYALGAQRGLSWGDSGEFQYWVLHCSPAICGASFSNSHPLYVVLSRMLASTPFQVTLVSSLFGALAVGGFYLCSRNVALSAVFGFTHMLWCLSSLAEVQTMNLALMAFATASFLSFLRSGKVSRLALAAFVSGVQLEVHNFALLSLPVYLAAYCMRFREMSPFGFVRNGFLVLVAWAAGAAYWIYNLFDRGLADVLVGAYGGKVSGLLPESPRLAMFNLSLAAMSFVAPLLLWRWRARSPLRAEEGNAPPKAVLALFAVNFIFFIRYFVPDQATFLLPSAFFAFLLLSDMKIGRTRLVALVAIELLLPFFALSIARQLPVSSSLKSSHPYRDEAAYFALPWKVFDRSADRFAAETPGVWTGYPFSSKGEVK
jgi:hypothetical protein